MRNKILPIAILLVLVLQVELLSAASPEANKEAVKQTLVTVDVTSPLVNEHVELKPIENHHFNLEAPQDCGRAGNIETTARKVVCQYRQAGDSKVTVSVCDNDKNYCKQEYVDVSVQKANAQGARLLMPVTDKTLKMQKEQKSLLLSGFKVLAPAEAKAVLKGEKGVLVLVSTEWCPPCNMLKEFMTSQDGFKELTKDYLLVYVDGDSNMANQWRDLLDSPVYPTFYAMNSDLEILDLKSSYMFLSDFKKWFELAYEDPSDSISDVKERLLARAKKTFSRSVLDAFLSEEEIERDVERYSRYNYGRFIQDDLVRMLIDLDPEKYKGRIARATYQNISYGTKTLADDSDLKAQMTKVKKSILATPRWDETDWVYNSLVEAECSAAAVPPGGEAEEKQDSPDRLIAKEDCNQLAEKMAARSKDIKDKDWSKKSEAEQLYSQALYAWNLGDLAKMRGAENASEYFKTCRDRFTEMAKLSPLKDKSRASRIYTSYCLEPGSTTESMQLVESLIEDFPFDSTFYYKKASLLKGSKKFKAALKFNSQALKYSYGDSWLDASLQRAKILKAMNKTSEAKKVIEDCLSEVVLSSENRRALRRVKLLRSELKTL